MNYDPSVANSNGYFKDPVTKQDLTGNEPRVVQCAIEDSGKLIWPQVKFSDGSVGKIVYKLWTAEEKAIYKQYRSLSKQKVPPTKKEPAHSQMEEKPSIQTEEVMLHDAMYEKCSKGSVASGAMLAYIKSCNEHLGVWEYDGITHDLLSVKGSNKYMPVPRVLIPKEDIERLGI